MLELVNLSNASFDVENLLQGSRERLDRILCDCGLDGIEFMNCAPWDRRIFPELYIKGVHLRFWPNWLDFWRGERQALFAEYGNKQKIVAAYGATRGEWLETWRENIRQAAACNPHYVVFHVANARTSEMYIRRFAYTDREVILATIELVNEIIGDLPDNCWLLFENLWWPGLTFLEPKLAETLLEGIRHKKTGFMLDTGHLMNTNYGLRSEEEAVRYILSVTDKMGSLRRRILGLHLHCSLPGSFAPHMRAVHMQDVPRPLSWQESMDYVMQIDRHQPFRTPDVRHLVQALHPQYLVHEFIQDSWEDWISKINIQRCALS